MSAGDWIMGNVSCKRFARHIASETEVLGGERFRWFYFLLHWVICPFCRGYWKEMRAINAAAQKLRAASKPLLKMDEFKDRLRKNLRDKS